MKLIVVKNPNVARRFAEALNILKREPDYFKGEEFYITWVLDLEGDKASAFVPSCFNYKENQIQSLQSLLNVLEGIILAVSSIEELKLFMKFYGELNTKNPVQKMQINSLTRKSIQKELENSIEILDFQAFLSNQKSNVKPISNCENNPKPVTNEVLEIESYQIQLTFTKDFLGLNAYSEQMFLDQQTAKDTLTTILRKGNLLVNEVQHETKIYQPPLLYNLTELQNDCKTFFGFTKDETLKLVESLYEKGLITYPDTEVQTIIKENWQEINGIVRALKTKPSLDLYINEMRPGNFSRRIVSKNNPLKMEGIYPTGIIPTALDLKENKVYDFIALRLLESLSEPCIMKFMEVKLSALNHAFKLQAFQLVEAGWRGFKNSFYDEHIEIYPHLPELKKDESLHITASKIVQS